MYWNLFVSFLKIGFISFGGGYAMIPVIEYEVRAHQWLSTQEFTDVVAIAGMSPGPIATNSAVFVGYKVGGMLGAAISAVAVSLPSLLIVVLLSLFMYKMKKRNFMDDAFYGLRPVITGLIAYAAIHFAMQNDMIGTSKLLGFEWIGILFVIAGLGLLLFTKINPVMVILLSGVMGVVIYY
ncbi:chromate transporter [Virgibacillus alimentarius]|uniref:Chromate transporter n=1 Tax=Virgibacillus alimentarius TaxID=698769 RepID=A0ABS4S8X4_9BACI|nr:chromate transporter [Virgibacillus alimentarius]MBP2257946.1 chromate transporter [Virgibacillus alimentarius]HLQ96076.1 chromate transporter [Pseudogracilibacillus sp.]